LPNALAILRVQTNVTNKCTAAAGLPIPVPRAVVPMHPEASGRMPLPLSHHVLMLVASRIVQPVWMLPFEREVRAVTVHPMRSMPNGTMPA
jgi:hypothetical protein